MKHTSKKNINTLSKRRGKLLTTYIIVILIFQPLIFSFIFFPELAKDSYPNLPSWFSVYIFFNVVITLISLYGLWNMKKWSVSLTAVGLIVEGGFETAITGSYSSATTVSILMFLIILRRWKYFS